MKKVIYSFVIILACMISMTSCKKLYHCSCTFNNEVKFTKDLGHQTQDAATKQCSAFDSTITGEVWKCTIY